MGFKGDFRLGITESTSIFRPSLKSYKEQDPIELLAEILRQMKIMNLYLSLLTNTELDEQDIL